METYQLGIYEKAMPDRLKLFEKLQSAKRAGYNFVELSIDETPQKLERLYLSKSDRLKLIEDMYQAGISLRSMCLSGHRKYPLGSNDKETEKKSLEIMRLAIELADDLGIRVIQLAGYDVYYEKGDISTRKRFCENIVKATKIAAGYGVILAFETMETAFMDTIAKAMKYVNMVDSNYLAVYPDLGNITNASALYQSKVESDIYSGRGHMCAMHLKETLPGIFREVPYGMGHVDFEKGIRAAWECGIRRYVAEFWDVGNVNWEEGLESTALMLRSILDTQK